MGTTSGSNRNGVVSALATAISATAISVAGITAIQNSEGVSHTAYPDIIGVPTICTGHTGPEVRLGQRATSEQCTKVLMEDLMSSENAVRSCVKVPISQNQFDALTSFAFNVGGGALCRSMLVRKLNAGDCKGAAGEFPKWSYAGGKQVKGLLVRRRREMTTFLKGCSK